jgi:hypothetical protein
MKSRLKYLLPMLAVPLFAAISLVTAYSDWPRGLLSSPFVFLIAGISILYLTTSYMSHVSTRVTEKRIEQIEVKAEKEPEKTKFAWDLARVKLEAYFDRNLSQVNMIFLVAVLVMIVGFSFILWGVMIAISKPEIIKTSYLAGISGIITEFIGVTFMLIYRSTMAQANQFMEVLERINTVGMAVQILDAIPNESTELKNSTRAEIVRLLLAVNQKIKTTTKSGAVRQRAEFRRAPS